MKAKTDRQRTEITGATREFVRKSAKNSDDPREFLAMEIRGMLLEKDGKAPTLETLKRMISEARNEKGKPEDEPWHMGLLREPKYTWITPDAARHIQLVQSFCDACSDPQGVEDFKKPITIRQATWLARLYQVILQGFAVYLRIANKMPKMYDPRDVNSILDRHTRLLALRELWRWSKAYATREIICGDSSFDTLKYDKAVLAGATAVAALRYSVLIFKEDKDGKRYLDVDSTGEDVLIGGEPFDKSKGALWDQVNKFYKEQEITFPNKDGEANG